MTAQEIVNIILILAIAGAVAFVAYHFGMLLYEFRKAVNDARPVIQSASALTEETLNDYHAIRSSIKGVLGFGDVVGIFRRFFNKKDKSEENDSN